jgi:hypothetical protein
VLTHEGWGEGMEVDSVWASEPAAKLRADLIRAEGGKAMIHEAELRR